MRWVKLAAAALAAATAPAQEGPGKAAPVAVRAEALARECAADRDKAEAKYKGKTLRVTGSVGDVYDDILYLPARVGQEEVLVGIRYGAGKKPGVKKGEVATFEGRFDRVAALGPALVECRLVPTKGAKDKK